MHIAYFDESGDDGFPKYSSPVFALSAIYLHHLHWDAALEAVKGFRRSLRDQVGLPVKAELHTKDFVLNKRPYLELGISDSDRIAVIDACCDLLASLSLRVVNVAIVKPRVRSTKYDVLDRALTMSVQRIENDLDPTRNPEAHFLIVTDEGRVGKMRSTTRRIRRVNFIPSKFGTGALRRDIRTLIEDPLPKPSRESYLIQAADLVAFIVYLYALVTASAGRFHGRMPSAVTPEKVADWLTRLLPVLNTAAHPADRFGVVFHPTLTEATLAGRP